MTVTGIDRTGIIAAVSSALAALDINIVDVSQTLMSGYFTMILRVEFDEERTSIDAIKTALKPVAEQTKQVIRIQSEALFSAMNEI